MRSRFLPHFSAAHRYTHTHTKAPLLRSFTQSSHVGTRKEVECRKQQQQPPPPPRQQPTCEREKSAKGDKHRRNEPHRCTQSGLSDEPVNTPSSSMCHSRTRAGTYAMPFRYGRGRGGGGWKERRKKRLRKEGEGKELPLLPYREPQSGLGIHAEIKKKWGRPKVKRQRGVREVRVQSTLDAAPFFFDLASLLLYVYEDNVDSNTSCNVVCMCAWVHVRSPHLLRATSSDKKTTSALLLLLSFSLFFFVVVLLRYVTY
jgi:hypothetical protein